MFVNPSRSLGNRAAVLLWAAAITVLSLNVRLFAGDAQLIVKVVDRDTGKPLAARMHLKNARGQAVKVPGVPYWHDHFVFDGEITLKLPTGEYSFELERGPEYLERTGRFTLKDFASDTKTVDMKRFVTMADEGWWSGELHVHRPIKDIELLMRAEDLHVAPVITWWNKRSEWSKQKPPDNPLVKFDENRFYHLMGGEDERRGGALLYFNLPKPLAISDAEPEYPSPMKYLEAARENKGLHVDLEKPFWWDAPVWLASGKVDTIGLANNHMNRGGMRADEAWGKPRDKRAYPDPWGNGRWSQDIYYHVLNAGLKIPPSAGSASGVLPNPVGYNRVYVYVGKYLNYDKWWEALRAGRVVVTNGPLLRPEVEGQKPGHTFQCDEGQELELQVALTLSTRDKVRYLEVVRDGRVEHEVRLDDWKKEGGKLPPVKFKRSGWFLVRAVTETAPTYRFASTGPYYVEVGGKPRISKTSAQFFLDWTRERMKLLKIDDPAKHREVIKYHEAAEQFWLDRVRKANAE